MELFIVHFGPKTLTEEVQRQRGKRAEKQACMCVNERERDRQCVCEGEKSQEVVVVSFKWLHKGARRRQRRELNGKNSQTAERKEFPNQKKWTVANKLSYRGMKQRSR